MIYESYPYFESIESYVSKHEHAVLTSLTEAQEEEYLCDLERDTFYAAFVLRKLIESKKIADSFADKEIGLRCHHPTQRGGELSPHDVDQHYDLTEERSYVETKKVGFLCNQLIHSKIFVFCFSEASEKQVVDDQIDGFFINSDQTSKRVLFHVSWTDWIQLLSSTQNYHIDFMYKFKNKDGSTTEHRLNTKADQELYKKLNEGN